VNDRVLLVEDDASICELVALGLGESGFRVDAVRDGADGVARFRHARYDAVVLDVMLPSLGGFDVLRAIRGESLVPVLMLTARTDTSDIVVGLELGADDYVRKPFEVPELAARLRAALRRSGEHPTRDVIVLGELDSIIPVKHGVAAHEAMPASQFAVFERAGHMPHVDDPYRFAKILTDFCDTTEPAQLTADHWQPLLQGEA